jgi:hypothetical protein
MKEASIYARTIFKERKITEYLAQKGIFPSREHGNRKMYVCPVHEGDTSPSMTVYTDTEYENYYCFGCHSGTTIINLVADMEKIDKRQAFKSLIQGLDIPGGAALEDISDSYDSFVKEGAYGDLVSMADVEDLSLRISVECYNFLNWQVNFDVEEVDFFEKVLQKVDALTRAKDKQGLEDIFGFLVEEGIPYRAELFYDKQEKKIIEESSEMEIWRSA